MDKIFVFGSNLAGVHGAGAAAFALEKHGAVWGVGVGPQGNAYAIPTKDERIETLPVKRIRPYVEQFKAYALLHPEFQFQVTAIGCGLAGYKPADIAPMFVNAPSNCEMPPEWAEYFRAYRHAMSDA